jgi:hypothetical protein
MKAPQESSPVSPASAVTIECTHCGVAMREHSGSNSRIRYFCCPCCRRWLSSTYDEIFRADAKIRIAAERPMPLDDTDFGAVKKRLEQWLTELESQDPYRVLGVSPRDSVEQIKSRYRQLALERHPDRGGSAERMKELNLAYGRIANREDHREADFCGDPTASSPRPARKR